MGKNRKKHRHNVKKHRVESKEPELYYQVMQTRTTKDDDGEDFTDIITYGKVSSFKKVRELLNLDNSINPDLEDDYAYYSKDRDYEDNLVETKVTILDEFENIFEVDVVLFEGVDGQKHTKRL